MQRFHSFYLRGSGYDCQVDLSAIVWVYPDVTTQDGSTGPADTQGRYWASTLVLASGNIVQVRQTVDEVMQAISAA